MDLWNEAVEVLQATMFLYSQATGGSLGMGIVVVSLAVRMVMLPITLRVARLTAAHQTVLRKLQPELDVIRERYASEPERVVRETRRLFAREGASFFPTSSIVGTVLQVPILLLLFSAVRRVAEVGGRFLWIRDIARPDIGLTVLVTALTGISVAVGAGSTEHGRMLLLAVPVVITFVALSQMGAGVGLYWGASGTVSIVQAALVRRTK